MKIVKNWVQIAKNPILRHLEQSNRFFLVYSNPNPPFLQYLSSPDLYSCPDYTLPSLEYGRPPRYAEDITTSSSSGSSPPGAIIPMRARLKYPRLSAD